MFNKFNDVRDNPYKGYYDLKPDKIHIVAGREYSIYPYGIKMDKPFVTNRKNTLLFEPKDLKVKHQLFPNDKYSPPQTLTPRPAVRISYDYRN